MYACVRACTCMRACPGKWVADFIHMRMKFSICSLLVFYDFLLLNIVVFFFFFFFFEKICEHRLSAARVGMSSHVVCLEVGERVGLSEK